MLRRRTLLLALLALAIAGVALAALIWSMTR